MSLLSVGIRVVPNFMLVGAAAWEDGRHSEENEAPLPGSTTLRRACEGATVRAPFLFYIYIYFFFFYVSCS